MKGTLYLIPTVLAEGTEQRVLSPEIPMTVGRLKFFLCENIRTARRFISALKVHPSIESLQFTELNKDTPEQHLPELLAPLSAGEDAGLLSEAGCPGVADPGALAVAFAHRHGIRVVPLTGPSSLLLGLMGSGLNGQRFAFHGYLPIEAKAIGTALRTLEQESREKNQTQLFIETPHRNNSLMAHLLRYLRSDTRLCLAYHLTSPEGWIKTLTVAEWKKNIPALDKVPVTFLFLAGAGR
ncbi:MAG: SAM-dependent methyltransferase [Cyclobacteriaceae bacterium]|nr:SAM-dependent methyltransferase [Cyclobacteriaceae bacterium]